MKRRQWLALIAVPLVVGNAFAQFGGRRRREGGDEQKKSGEEPRINLGATWGLSETGASGPTGNRYGDAPGHACIAVSGPVEAAITVETASSDREANMWAFARRALELLESCLLKT